MDVLTNLFPSNILYSGIMPFVKNNLSFSSKDLQHSYNKIKEDKIISLITKAIFRKTKFLCSYRDTSLRSFVSKMIQDPQKWNSISIYGFKDRKCNLFFVTCENSKIQISDLVLNCRFSVFIPPNPTHSILPNHLPKMTHQIHLHSE